MMSQILFRCDASLLIGSGHVMRCRTLARELQRRGAQIRFLCRRQPGDLIELLEQEFEVLALPEQQLSTCQGLEGRDLYLAWLGCTQDIDSADCFKALAQCGINSANWLVVDHYGLDACWEAQMLAGVWSSATPPQLLVIDDLSDRPHQADLLLDQNFFGEDTYLRYQVLVPPHCRQLLGPYYALLGPEYSQLHPVVPSRNRLQRVLIFFGGVDSFNLTGRALEALLDPIFNDLSVDVVLGQQCPHRLEIEKLVACRPYTTLHEPLSSLAGLIARADLAIGAGGGTTWERICLALPSLVVVLAENQLPFVQCLDQAGHLQLLGEEANVTVDHIRAALSGKLAEHSVSQKTNPVSDGYGVQRLMMAMFGPQEKISLRPALASDESLVLHWANDPLVRANSFSMKPIDPVDHHYWFTDGLSNPNRLMFIAMSGDRCPIGQLRLDLKECRADGAFREAKLSFSLDRCARGHGLAVDLVQLGLQAMQERWGTAIEVVAEVFSSNKASNACFDRADFILESEFDLSLDTISRAVKRWRWVPA